MRAIAASAAALVALTTAARADHAHAPRPVVASAVAPAEGALAAPAAPPTAARTGLAFGVEAGEPTAATIGWFTHGLGATVAIGTGTRAGLGLQLRADLSYQPTILARLGGMTVPLVVGAGVRYYHHGYQPASIDELPDTHVGVRASLAIGLDRDHLRVYAEAAPGLDVYRSPSCTLQSGVHSICPHAQESPLFVQVVLGARWFLR
ncbi:MAG: hypothetical protein K8W52_30015 [Deltaproteobacteria bacterium]|nr:hypothetical protein [Deltaproteobacteria bacterium]